MFTVDRNKTHFRRYIRNNFCARNTNISWWYNRNVYCAQKQNICTLEVLLCKKQTTFLTVFQKCVLFTMLTETKYIPGGKSIICTVQETEKFLDRTSDICSVQINTLHSRRYIIMCTVHRDRTHSRRYIRKFTVQRKQINSRRYIRYLYCAQKHNTF
jgi:hypothetical protein